MADTTPSPLPEWCGAGLYTPVVAEDGRIVAESRRMCGLKEPHEWHQDRYDATVRWKAPSPFVERPCIPRQADVLAWVAARWPEYVTPVWRAMKVGEEGGEVLGAVIKSSLGLKPASAIENETAQLIICAMALAESCGFDWRAAVAAEWQDMSTRVWTPEPVTPSRTDKQPPNPVVGANGGLSAVAPGTTNRPDLVTHHDPSAEDAE